MSAAPRLAPSAAPSLRAPSVDLTPVQKAAVFIMYLEREAARALLRNLSDDEVKRIGAAINSLGEVDEAVIEGVVGDFVDELSAVSILPSSGPDFARNVLPDLIDEERRPRISAVLRRQGANEFETFISARPANAVASVLGDEHPQVRAIALLRMGAENAARVLACMPEVDRADITIRMARAKRVDAEIVDDVEAALRRALSHLEGPTQVGGVENTARILGRMSREVNTALLGQVRKLHETLAEDLQRRMVVFEDLGGLDARAIQALLRAVERPDLVLALKGANPPLRDRFLENLSSRAAADLLEEIELTGRARRSLVREAQDRVVAAARRLADDGAIDLEIGGNDEAVG